MKRGFKFACLAAIFSLHFSAHADARLDSMKQMNIDGCVSVIQLDKKAPKDAKLAKPYCSCVYNTYFDGLTTAEQNKLFSSPMASTDPLLKSLPGRLEAATNQCSKKFSR